MKIDKVLQMEGATWLNCQKNAESRLDLSMGLHPVVVLWGNVGSDHWNESESP